MGYLLLAISGALSVQAFRFWISVWVRRVKLWTDIADDFIVTGEWIDLVTLVLPRTPRRIWMTLLGTCAWLLLGLPHYLVLAGFFQPEVGPWLYAHYLWTLVYWLGLLAFPALIICRLRLARRPPAAAASPP